MMSCHVMSCTIHIHQTRPGHFAEVRTYDDRQSNPIQSSQSGFRLDDSSDTQAQQAHYAPLLLEHGGGTSERRGGGARGRSWGCRRRG